MQLLRAQRLHRVGGQHRPGKLSLDLGTQKWLRAAATSQPTTVAASAAVASAFASAHSASSQPATHTTRVSVATPTNAALSLSASAA